MDLPFFYVDTGLVEGAVIEPAEETARHMVQVLRMREGAQLVVTNGQGRTALCSIQSTSKKSCTLLVGPVTVTPDRKRRIAIAISLLKNVNRFEWFLEKAAELGVARIIPLQCARTEKQHFRKDRAQSILISAMQQSQQAWITGITDPVKLGDFLSGPCAGQKFIAHCEPSEKYPLRSAADTDATILIGPEGDFTPAEISAALHHGFQPVSLGDTRLRTETAGIVAATLLCVEAV